MARLSHRHLLASVLTSLILFQTGARGSRISDDEADQDDEKTNDLTPSERALIRTVTASRAIYPGFGGLGYGGFGYGGLGYGGLGYGGYGLGGFGLGGLGYGGLFFDEDGDQDNEATIDAAGVEAGDDVNDENGPTERRVKGGKSKSKRKPKTNKPGKKPTSSRGGGGEEGDTVTLKIRFPRQSLEQVIKQFGFQCKDKLPSIGDDENDVGSALKKFKRPILP